jgi:hypothetical protein
MLASCPHGVFPHKVSDRHTCMCPVTLHMHTCTSCMSTHDLTLSKVDPQPAPHRQVRLCPQPSHGPRDAIQSGQGCCRCRSRHSGSGTFTRTPGNPRPGDLEARRCSIRRGAAMRTRSRTQTTGAKKWGDLGGRTEACTSHACQPDRDASRRAETHRLRPYPARPVLLPAVRGLDDA